MIIVMDCFHTYVRNNCRQYNFPDAELYIVLQLTFLYPYLEDVLTTVLWKKETGN